MIATRLALVQAAARGFAVEESSEYTSIERIAKVLYHLMSGEGMRTRDVARVTQLPWREAYRLMCTISRVLPIYQDEQHVWQLLVMKELIN